MKINLIFIAVYFIRFDIISTISIQKEDSEKKKRKGEKTSKASIQVKVSIISGGLRRK